LRLEELAVEALQGFVVGRQVDGRPVTPHLNALAKETLYFPAIFGQTSAGGTSDAELLVQASLHPREHGAAFVLHGGNTFRSLPRVEGCPRP
jgi:phosphoglycerol transferase MdoB-like AlkP superfamily enzyme